MEELKWHSLIRLEKVSKCYHSGGAAEVYPLREVDLEIYHGERIVLLGKSGSGKSTFLNLVGGVDIPSSGRVFFEDLDITSLSATELGPISQKRSGLCVSSLQSVPNTDSRRELDAPAGFAGHLR